LSPLHLLHQTQIFHLCCTHVKLYIRILRPAYFFLKRCTQ
jgi:hypothetical protein